MPKDPRIKKVMVIGSGPIIIGQALSSITARYTRPGPSKSTAARPS